MYGLTKLKKKVAANEKKLLKLCSEQRAGKPISKRLSKLQRETKLLLEKAEDIDRIVCNRYFQRYGIEAFKEMDRETNEYMG